MGVYLGKEATPPWGSVETDLQGPTRGGVNANMGKIGLFRSNIIIFPLDVINTKTSIFGCNGIEFG
jgi:hypothetical protein